MTKYKIRKDFEKQRHPISHKKHDFFTIFYRIVNLMKKQNLKITKYEEDNEFAYIELEERTTR